MRRTILALPILASVAFTSPAQRVNSIAKKLRLTEKSHAQNSAEPFDTIVADSGTVRFSGYEKILRTTKETVFVTNLLEDKGVEAVFFTITYTDNAGRLLHKRRVTARQEIPAGETRKIDFPTWDRQMTFYYTGSPRPRVSAIPYDVAIEPDTILLSRDL